MELSKSLLPGACLGILLVASVAGAQVRSDVLASGERGRSYHDVFGVNMLKLLPGFRIRNRATSGSAENLELLADGKADLGFAQSDVYAERMRSDRKRYATITVVGRLVDECVYVVRQREGPVHSLADLGTPISGRPARVAVGPEGSGMSVTWSLLSKLMPALAGAKVVHTGGVLSLNQLGLGMLDAVSWVSDPDNRSHALLQATLAAPELALLPITDPALEHALDDGTPIYRLRSVALADGRNDHPLQTLCTSALVFASAKANPRLVEKVSQALSLQRDAILGRY
jgi:TRAP-type uncharacterized transport system substrate-binding protein